MGTQKVSPTVLVGSGTTPTGTISISENGTHDVTNYATAEVSVSGGGSDPIGILFQGEVDENGAYTMPYNLTWTGNISFDGIKSIGNYNATSGGAFASYLYHQANQGQRLKCRLIIGTVTFPDLETVNGASCFQSFCNGQTQLTSVSFPKLYSANGNNCFAYAFQGCTNLTDIYFNAVTSSTASAFKSALGGNMLQQVTNCKVHFPSNLSSIIGSLTFGGSGNTGTVFDLPATS